MAKQQQKSPIVTLAIYGILAIGMYYVYTGAMQLTQRVQLLPVEGLIAERDPTIEQFEAPKTLHPLLVEASKRTAVLKRATGDTYDVLFGKRDAEAEAARLAAEAAAAAAAVESVAAPVNPLLDVDFFKALEPVIAVQAVAGDVVIVNGKLLEVGDKLTNMPYPNIKEGVYNYPVLKSISVNGIVLKEESGTRTIEVPFKL